MDWEGYWCLQTVPVSRQSLGMRYFSSRFIQNVNVHFKQRPVYFYLDKMSVVQWYFLGHWTLFWTVNQSNFEWHTNWRQLSLMTRCTYGCQTSTRAMGLPVISLPVQYVSASRSLPGISYTCCCCTSAEEASIPVVQYFTYLRILTIYKASECCDW